MRHESGIRETMAKRASLAGGGLGLGMFAVYGVMDATFIGGVIGLNLAGAVLGFPVESAIISRALVSLGMLGGVFVAGMTFVAAGAAAGWLAGKIVDAIYGAMHKRESMAHTVGSLRRM